MTRAGIEVAGLTKSFVGPRPWREAVRRPFARRKVRALDGVALSAAEGEVLALVGPNGAGKTTLLKILCTLIAPDAGVVKLGEIDALRDTLGARRAVGLVTADERSFYWRLSGRHNLEFFASLHGLDGKANRDRVSELLERVDLTSAADAPFREYSTGMKQKLALCRGILHRPRALLLDEPTRGIDLAALRVLRTMLREHVAASGAALLASHDLAEIEALDCRVALLRGGRITSQGSIAELRRAAGTSEVLELLLADAATWRDKLAEDPRVAAISLETDVLVITLAKDAVAGDLIAAIHSAGGRVLRVRPRGASLEAVLDA